MRIKNEVEYVFRIILYLAKNGKNRIVTSSEISKNEEIPHLFSLRILKKMEKAGLVEIYKGAKGGYKLKKPAKEITLRCAIESIETNVSFKYNVEDEKEGEETGRAKIHNALVDVEENFVKKLGEVNFQDLLDDKY